MKIINNDNFEQVVKGEGAILVDFWAEWCGPCKMLLPIMEELSIEMATKVGIYKCNVDECSDVASSFNIKSIPTLILFKNNEIIDIHSGAASKAFIKQWLESKL
ncbi:MAG: thioredoxin [Rickettsiales bacterium]|jgi:thioredoxin 1|nr:thioredoxin [Rickettsiales bacterium]